MAKNTLQDLRDHLFATLESLADAEKPMEIERAKAICATASQIIDSARVEVKYIEATGQGEKRAEKFFGADPQMPITITGRRNLPA